MAYAINAKVMIKRFLRRVLPGVVVRMLTRILFEILEFPRAVSLRKPLQQVMADHADCKGIVVIVPGLDWNIPLFQRPQQLARAFAGLGYLVLYGTPNYLDKVRTVSKVADNLFLVPNLYVLREVPNPIVYAYWGTMRGKLFIFKERPRLIYDYMDELQVFDLPQAKLAVDHEWMLKNAALISATATSLYEQVAPKATKAILCPNAVDYPFFHRVPKPEAPADLRPLLDRPIIGYYGAIAEWFDYELLTKMAHAFPECHIVIIGVKYDKTADQHDWAATPNVHFLGPRPYSELPAYAAHFSVATIPFMVNAITHSTSPVKLFEYLAAGCATVTTDMPECRKYASVYVGKSHEDFLNGIRKALRGEFDPCQIDADARHNDWTARARAMLVAVGEDMGEEAVVCNSGCC